MTQPLIKTRFYASDRDRVAVSVILSCIRNGSHDGHPTEGYVTSPATLAFWYASMKWLLAFYYDQSGWVPSGLRSSSTRMLSSTALSSIWVKKSPYRVRSSVTCIRTDKSMNISRKVEHDFMERSDDWRLLRLTTMALISRHGGVGLEMSRQLYSTSAAGDTILHGCKITIQFLPKNIAHVL